MPHRGCACLLPPEIPTHLTGVFLLFGTLPPLAHSLVSFLRACYFTPPCFLSSGSVSVSFPASFLASLSLPACLLPTSMYLHRLSVADFHVFASPVCRRPLVSVHRSLVTVRVIFPSLGPKLVPLHLRACRRTLRKRQRGCSARSSETT